MNRPPFVATKGSWPYLYCCSTAMCNLLTVQDASLLPAEGSSLLLNMMPAESLLHLKLRGRNTYNQTTSKKINGNPEGVGSKDNLTSALEGKFNCGG